MVIDGVNTPPSPIKAGVPQGSPLSPILFVLFIASLYTDLHTVPGQLSIGYADDTNVVAFGRTEAECIRTLEMAYEVAHKWAEVRGMAFEPAKSEVIHFKRRGPSSQTPVDLCGYVVKPQESGRFLGIWLDRRLAWTAHIAAVRGKLTTQMNALTRLAASTWGCSVLRAREIYTKVVRSCIAYGAGVFHDPCKPKVAKALAPQQTRALKVVLGAYKATPTCALELDAYCPPLDLYFNQRLADFERRMHLSGLREKLRRITTGIVAKVKQRRRRRRPARLATVPGCHWEWAKEWAGDSGDPSGKWESSKKTLAVWKQRWQAATVERPAVAAMALPGAFDDRPTGERQASFPQARIQRRDDGAAGRKGKKARKGHPHLRLYERTAKAYGSVICQARTGKIGLREFLFRCRVPTVTTPICPCGNGPQNVAHLLVDCLHERSQPLRRLGYPTPEAVQAGLCNRETALGISRALVQSGWLPQYRVFQETRRYFGKDDDNMGRAWSRRPP